jgi:hypothetical protein
MYLDYHTAIVQSQFEQLSNRIARDQWTNVSLERNEAQIYVTLSVSRIVAYRYLVRIDMTAYPVEPYWIGFLKADLPREHWSSASDGDPRFWPWSPMPGLHGSFIVAFQGPFRTFWCRECTFPFFYYHGDRPWIPASWPLERLVAHLREAVELAEPPVRWRPIQRQSLIAAATTAGINLPEDAGLGAK